MEGGVDAWSLHDITWRCRIDHECGAEFGGSVVLRLGREISQCHFGYIYFTIPSIL